MLISFILTGMKNIMLCFNKYFKWENFPKINYYNILITTHHLFLQGNILSYLYSNWSVHSKPCKFIKYTKLCVQGPN